MNYKLKESCFLFTCTQEWCVYHRIDTALVKIISWYLHLRILERPSYCNPSYRRLSLVTAEWSFPQYCEFMSYLPGQQQNCYWFMAGEDV